MTLVVAVLYSLIIFTKHLLYPPIYDELQVSSGQVHWCTTSCCKSGGFCPLGASGGMCIASFEYYLCFGVLENSPKFLSKSLDVGD